MLCELGGDGIAVSPCVLGTVIQPGGPKSCSPSCSCLLCPEQFRAPATPATQVGPKQSCPGRAPGRASSHPPHPSCCWSPSPARSPGAVGRMLRPWRGTPAAAVLPAQCTAQRGSAQSVPEGPGWNQQLLHLSGIRLWHGPPYWLQHQDGCTQRLQTGNIEIVPVGQCCSGAEHHHVTTTSHEAGAFCQKVSLSFCLESSIGALCLLSWRLCWGECRLNAGCLAKLEADRESPSAPGLQQLLWFGVQGQVPAVVPIPD